MNPALPDTFYIIQAGTLCDPYGAKLDFYINETNLSRLFSYVIVILFQILFQILQARND